MKLNRTTLTYITALSLLAPLAAWLGHLGLCLYSRDLPLCDHPASAYIILSATEALVIGYVALAVRIRLHRRLLGGMYARPVGIAGRRVYASMVSAARVLWEGETVEPGTHPLTSVPEGYGWRVAMDDGSVVIVYFDAFRSWVYDCWELQRVEPRRGATSRRVWRERGLSDEQIAARNYLLDLSGKVRRNKASVNSIRRIDATPWPVIEATVAAWEPGEVV